MTRALILPILWACIGIVLAVWSIPAWGQDYTATYAPKDPDDLFMRESQEGHLAEVFYSNSASSSSTGVNEVFSYERDDGTVIEAHVRVRIGGHDVNMAEIIEVTPLHPQHSAFPAGPVNVMDGEEIVIQIMAPMF